MEERIVNLENQLKAALEELETIKKELAEEKARNASLKQEITQLTAENTQLKQDNESLKQDNESLKISIKEWQDKYEKEHMLVIKLTEENEQLKAQIVELENQRKIENEKPYNIADLKEYMNICNKIKLLESKLETSEQEIFQTKSKLEEVNTAKARLR